MTKGIEPFLILVATESGNVELECSPYQQTTRCLGLVECKCPGRVLIDANSLEWEADCFYPLSIERDDYFPGIWSYVK